MLHINYLHFRRDFYPLLIQILNKVNRPFKFNFLTDETRDINKAAEYFHYNANFDCHIEVFRSRDNYRAKIQWVLNNMGDDDTMCKYDEDQIMSPSLLEYFIDNQDIVHKDDCFWLAAWSPNGVTSADEFAQKFFDKDTLQKYNELCRTTRIGKDANTICPGATPEYQAQYDKLNEATVLAKEWVSDKWYELLWQVEHYYRGLHPVRIRFELTKLVNEFVLNNMDVFFSKDYYIYNTYKYPYYCNSHYLTSKSKLAEIAQLMHARKDFDEASMNILRLEKGLPITFVGNSTIIHTLYGNARCSLEENEWSNPDGDSWENNYYERLYGEVVGYLNT